MIGVPHPDLGEALLALIVPSASRPTRPSSRRTAASGSRRTRCRATYEFRDDLVRNAMGKLDKKAMRAPYWHDERTIAG